jgi:hypothetical protein
VSAKLVAESAKQSLSKTEAEFQQNVILYIKLAIDNDKSDKKNCVIL